MACQLPNRLAIPLVSHHAASKFHQVRAQAKRASTSQIHTTHTWALIATDFPNALSKRMSVREAHLARANKNHLILGGAMLDKENGNMTGSIVVFEAPDRYVDTPLLHKSA